MYLPVPNGVDFQFFVTDIGTGTGFKINSLPSYINTYCVALTVDQKFFWEEGVILSR